MSKSRTYCVVYGCKNKYNSAERVSFHSFPKEGQNRVKWVNKNGTVEKLDRKKAWMLALKSEPERVTKHSKVCSEHFSAKNFFYPDAVGLRIHLKKDAIPDLLLPQVPLHGSFQKLAKKVVKRSIRQASHRHSAEELKKEMGLRSKSKSYCCVYGCRNTYSSADDISFHQFPKQGQGRVKWVNLNGEEELIDRRLAWILALNCVPERVTDASRVCSKHFLKKNMFPWREGVPRKNIRLKSDAIPDQRLPELPKHGNSIRQSQTIKKTNYSGGSRNRRKEAGNWDRKVSTVDPDNHSLGDSVVVKQENTDDLPFKAQPPQCNCCICYKLLPQSDAITTEGSQFGQVFFSILKVEPSSLLSNFCCPSCGEDVMQSFEATLDISISAMLTSRRSLGKSLAEALDEGCVRCGSVFPTVEELTDHFTDHVLEDCKRQKKNAEDNFDARKLSGYSSIPSETPTNHAMSTTMNLPKIALLVAKHRVVPNKPSAMSIQHSSYNSSRVPANIENNDANHTDSAPESNEPPITMKPRCIVLEIDEPTRVAPKPTEGKSTQVTLESNFSGSNCEKLADTAPKSSEEQSPQMTVNARDDELIIDTFVKLNQKAIRRFDIERSVRETSGGLVDDQFPYTLKYDNDLRSLLKDEHSYNKQKISRVTEQSFLCYLCGKKYSTRHLMRKHYRQHETGTLPTRVKSANPRYRRKKGDPPRRRGRPIKERKVESQPTVASLTMVCNECNDVLDDRSKLVSHMQMHHKGNKEGAEAGEVRIWVCRLCNRKLTSTVTADQHRLHCRLKSSSSKKTDLQRILR